MKMDRICVRRLKSFWDYSNVAVELCASLDEGDDVDKVYGDLLEKANLLIARTKELENVEDLRRRIEEERRAIQNQVEHLETILKELEDQREKLAETINEANTLLNETLKTKSKMAELIEYLKGRLKR